MWLILFLALFEFVSGNKPDNQLHLPQYVELDNYDQCLSSNNGLYCFGTFLIHPNLNNSELYDFIKKYSARRLTYNRRKIHRGYCVSSRCPQNSIPSNKHFENCVQKWESNKGLNTTLENLTYCRTKKRVNVLNNPSKIFLIVIFLVIMLNLVGTWKEVRRKEVDTVSKFWSSWSIRLNWEQFLGPFGNDPDMSALAPMQIMRVVLMTVVLILHVAFICAEAFLQNPEWFEQMLMMTPMTIFYAQSLSVVQVFHALSSFLTAYNLLLMTKRQKIGLWMLPKQMMKRYFRIAPVHLLFVGFAMTLWPLISDGPIWSARIDADSAICQRKFWAHFFHISNFVEPKKFCYLQTWSLVVDIQLQLVSVFLTLSMAQFHLSKLKTLNVLLVLSCLLNAGLAYHNEWKTFLQLLNEIDIANSFRQQPEDYLAGYYFSPWGNLPSCLVGLIFGHVYFKLRQEGFKVNKRKIWNHWLGTLCRYSLPLMLLWVSAGYLTQNVESRWLLALLVGIDRPMFAFFPCLWLFGMISGVRSIKKLTHPIWMPLGRLSLSVLMVHWVIITTRFSSGSDPVVMSWWNYITEIVIAWCLSYLLAIPITLLVEMPIMNTFSYICSLDIKLFKLYHKYVAKNSLKKED